MIKSLTQEETLFDESLYMMSFLVHFTTLLIKFLLLLNKTVRKDEKLSYDLSLIMNLTSSNVKEKKNLNN